MMKVFISHTSSDKDFVSGLAYLLKELNVSVWYDQWEVKVGDSIVEKVFEGIASSDALIVVLSQASVQSNWVKEELNTAVIRAIEERNILLLPVLIEDCDLPTSLRQRRYADFRADAQQGLADLLEAIEPERTLWECLKRLNNQHALIIKQIKQTQLDESVEEQVKELHEIMSTALDVRCQIEQRRAVMHIKQRDFFSQVDVLADRGLNIRSQTWSNLVYFRNALAHNSAMYFSHAIHTTRDFLIILKHGILRESPEGRDREQRTMEYLYFELDKLSEIMGVICDKEIRLQTSKEDELREQILNALHIKRPDRPKKS